MAKAKFKTKIEMAKELKSISEEATANERFDLALRNEFGELMEALTYFWLFERWDAAAKVNQMMTRKKKPIRESSFWIFSTRTLSTAIRYRWRDILNVMPANKVRFMGIVLKLWSHCTLHFAP